MKKRKTLIYRYWVVYQARRSRRNRGLCEVLRTRPSAEGYGGEVYVQNLETGEVLQNTLTFRQIGEMTNRIAKNGFKKRNLGLRSIEAPKLKLERARKRRETAKLPESKLKSLVALEKSWVRKAKFAATKLKKIRKKIKYYQTP